MAIRTATAEWKGDLPSGTGTFSSASGALDGAYSFESRFTDERRHEPGGADRGGAGGLLLDAARAMLARAATKADSVRTEAKVQILKQGEGFAITRIELVTVARVPGIDDAAFQQTAKAAKEACLISKALARRAGDHARGALEG